ncbi:hypothetical protein NGC38_22015 [Kluyvera cryocrescens]|uniref:hypothetical protein n=1 Tax=Kluyvera cryocrescens TaxID=580 RepID=UPI002DBD0BB7|nr:hypothetical protein [Kluyvera cryocrescens]MEB7559190.1 hypothetical protein [Kluyvera cryocrescens]
MGAYKYSKSTNYRYPVQLLDSYQDAGVLPTDLIDITDEDAGLFFEGEPPEGKVRGAGDDGYPCWVDIKEKPADELYDEELSLINSRYLSDIEILTTSYAQASLFDGPLEQQKKTAIYTQLQNRNIAYAAELNRLNEKYGVE